MKHRLNTYQVLQLIGLIAVIILAIIYFQVTLNVFVAGLLSILAYPIAKWASKWKFRKKPLGNGFGAFIALIAIVLVILGIASILIPLVMYEASQISSIDFQSVSKNLKTALTGLEEYLIRHKIINSTEYLETYLLEKAQSAINFSQVSNLFTGFINYTGSFFFNTFTILFSTFFLIKDRKKIIIFLLRQIPKQHQVRIGHILEKIEKLLSRYFVGLVIEILCMMVLLSIGLSIFNIKSAIFLGCMGGLLNTIPYLGPFMGAIIAIIVNLTGCLGEGCYHIMLGQSLIIAAVFIVSNAIDNIVFQPIIYSQSVHSNPLEIFLVLILAGSIGGIIGMILGIPTYTIIKTSYGEMMKYIKEISEEKEKRKHPHGNKIQ